MSRIWPAKARWCCEEQQMKWPRNPFGVYTATTCRNLSCLQIATWLTPNGFRGHLGSALHPEESRRIGFFVQSHEVFRRRPGLDVVDVRKDVASAGHQYLDVTPGLRSHSLRSRKRQYVLRIDAPAPLEVIVSMNLSLALTTQANRAASAAAFVERPGRCLLFTLNCARTRATAGSLRERRSARGSVPPGVFHFRFETRSPKSPSSAYLSSQVV